MTAATLDVPAQRKLQPTISRVEEKDLEGWAEGQMLAFGERLYGEVEPLPSRASWDDRVTRTGKPVVAALAFWHLPGAKVDNVQKHTEQEVLADLEAFEGYDWKKWNEMMEKYDVVRRREMEDRPHWYLGPLWTHPDYQGVGLAGQLLRHAIFLADSATPPAYTLPNAGPGANSRFWGPHMLAYAPAEEAMVLYDPSLVESSAAHQPYGPTPTVRPCDTAPRIDPWRS
ncbi:hypothetical protein JCM11251_003992 [Rhodosporidiobolus azoricus]